MARKIYTLLILAGLLLTGYGTSAQRRFVNTSDSVYELTGGIGNCTYTNLGRFCLPATEQMLSLAMHKDTLYILTSSADLYRVELSSPGSCTLVTTFPRTSSIYSFTAYTALTCDKNGVLYAVDIWSTDLYRYDPRYNEIIILGQLPARPAGDMLFYRDTLLYAAANANIYAVDLNQPSSSPIYMSTANSVFYGLIAIPDDCNRNRLFGINPYYSSDVKATLVEIDPVNKTVGNTICTYPFSILDATSTVEDGSYLGELIDSLDLQAPCGAVVTGNLQVFASSVSDLNTTYTLDGSLTNSSGLFAGISPGSHSIHIQTSPTCFADSVFTIKRGLSDQVILQTVNITDCLHPNGSIAITATSESLPILYSLNGGPPQAGNIFDHLKAGQYTVVITDAGHCEKDTSLSLILETTAPTITADIGNQLCSSDDGHIFLSIGGVNGPYQVSVNKGVYTPAVRYPGLKPATYAVSVQDKNSCTWDTAFAVLPYTNEPVRIAVDTVVNPVCTELNSGSVTVSIQGNRPPYWLGFNNATYPSGDVIGHFSSGNYSLPVINADGCVVDSAHVHLDLDLKPECNTIYLPSAFSPNSNGVNELFRVIHNPYLTQIELRVYNRFGELLFTSSAQRPGWDGTFHGIAQPVGTYVWMVSYTDLQKVRKGVSGTVLLVR